MTALKHTELYQWHVEHGARMVPFAGWEMPVQYPTGPLEEHHTTRRAAGLFDIDHMGQIEVRGPHAEVFVNRMVGYDVRKLALWDAHYSLLCYADGGTVDDLFIYKVPDGDDFFFFLVVNASNRAKDVSWIKSHAAGFDVSIEDISEATYMLAFQGPEAVPLLDTLTETDLTKVPRFTAIESGLFGTKALVGRTGYTGEDGFELFFPADHALSVWEGILEAGQAKGIQPVGLAARDSLRFEPGMPLYGHELTPTRSPVEARLTFGLSLDKDFIGRDALLKQKLEGTEDRLAGFEMVARGVPREGYEVYHDGEKIGEVTTGMFAPTLDRYLGMTFLKREFAKVGTEIAISVRGKHKAAKVVNRPFYTPVYRR